MDTNKVPYFSINRYFLMSIGLWPNDATTIRGIQKFIISAVILSSIFPQIGALVKYRSSFYTCCRIITYVMPSCVYAIKYFNFAFDSNHRIRRMLEWVQTDWETYIKKEEHEILERHCKNGRTLLIAHIIIIYPAVIANAIFPYLPWIYNVLTHQNETNLKTPILLEYYIFNGTKHVYWSVLHVNAFYLVGSQTVIATEMINMLFVAHASAMFELVSYYVNTAVENTIVHSSKSVIHKYIKSVVQVHYRTLGFIGLLNSGYLIHYSFILVIGVITLSINLYIFADSIFNPRGTDVTIMAFVLILCHVSYMMMCCFIGQKVINESDNVFVATYCTRWYLAPLPMQKFLILFLERCLKSSCFVIGGLVKPCLELLSTALNISMSYFMVLWSLS